MSDSIYREDAIRTVCECECYSGDNPCEEGKGCYAVNELRKLSSADRPRGMWELVPCTDLSEYFEGVKNGFRFRCTNCKDERKRNKHDMNFCPNCGARMKGADDE